MSWVGLRIHERGERDELGNCGCGGGDWEEVALRDGEQVTAIFKRHLYDNSIHSIPKLPSSLPAANPKEHPIQTLTIPQFPIRTSVEGD